MARTATTTDAYNAIAEVSRRDLLDALGTGEATVGDLVDQLGLTQPQVSKHLRVLRTVGIVDVRGDGRHRWYRINGRALKPIHDWVRTFEQTWNARLDRLDDLLTELNDTELSDTGRNDTEQPSDNGENFAMTNPTVNRHGSAVITTPSDTEICITRVFDAHAELVFAAWTEPELVKRWWGFATAEWLVCDIELRVGGRWRWVVHERDMVVGFHGEYREIARPSRLVFTEAYEGHPDPNASLNTLTFDERDGVTTMTVLVQHANREDRDGQLASGMERGMQVSFNRLDELVRGNE